MSKAQINGQYVPLSYELQNGDVVSIITEPDAKPSVAWMHFARSRSTRAKLRSFFRAQERIALVAKGWLYVRNFMDEHARLLQQSFGYLPSEAQAQQLMIRSAGSVDDLCISVAKTKEPAVMRAMLAQMFSLRFDQVEASAAAHRTLQRLQNRRYTDSQPITQEHEPQACSLCMPLPGDLVRIIEGPDSATVHRRTCPELEDDFEGPDDASELSRWTGTQPSDTFQTKIKVVCGDRKFLLRDISDIVAVNADIVSTASHTSEGIAFLDFTVEVASAAHLAKVNDAVLQVPGVLSCDRAPPGTR